MCWGKYDYFLNKSTLCDNLTISIEATNPCGSSHTAGALSYFQYVAHSWVPCIVVSHAKQLTNREVCHGTVRRRHEQKQYPTSATPASAAPAPTIWSVVILVSSGSGFDSGSGFGSGSGAGSRVPMTQRISTRQGQVQRKGGSRTRMTIVERRGALLWRLRVFELHARRGRFRFPGGHRVPLRNGPSAAESRAVGGGHAL